MLYLSWYDYVGDKIYYIYKQEDKDKLVFENDQYDYIVIDCIKNKDESIINGQDLKEIKKFLSARGRLILVGENKLGIGNMARATFLGKTKQEYIDAVKKAEFSKYKFYYPFPSGDRPQIIYTDERPLAIGDLYREMNYYPRYKEVYFEKRDLYEDLVKEKLFPSLNDSFIVECSLDGCVSEDLFVIQTINRRRQYGFATKIFKNKVIKKPLYKEGHEHVCQLRKNTEDLKRRGFNVLDFQIKDGAICMDYVKNQKLSDYLSQNLSKEEIFQLLDRLWQDILNSSEHTEELSFMLSEARREKYGPILKNVYPDFVHFNIFYKNDEFIYFDQEFVEHNLPAKYIMFRVVANAFVFIKNGAVQLEELKDRYGLKEIWNEMFRIEHSIWDSWYDFDKLGIEYRKIDYKSYINNKKDFVDMFYQGEADYSYIKRIRKSKILSVELLSVFVRIAEENRLTYYPLFGTLLGAIRSGKMIPWDTDIDIAMPREDYEKLKYLGPTVKEPYELYTPSAEEPSFTGGYMRLMNKNTTVIETKNLYKKSKDGFFIDILPLDKTYVDRQKNRDKAIDIMDIKLSIHAKTYGYDPEVYAGKELERFVEQSRNEELKRFFLDCEAESPFYSNEDYKKSEAVENVDCFLEGKGKNNSKKEKVSINTYVSKTFRSQWENKPINVTDGDFFKSILMYFYYKNRPISLKSLYTRLEKEIIKGDNESTCLGIYTSMHKLASIFEKKDLLCEKSVEFESVKIPLPTGHDNILKKCYGKDYMGVPSLENRVSQKKYFFKDNVPYRNYHKRFDLSNLRDKKVILFGAGHSLYNFLNDCPEVEPLFIVDNDENKWGLSLEDLVVPRSHVKKEFQLDLKELNRKYGCLSIQSPSSLKGVSEPVVISSMYFQEIETQIRTMGIKENYYIYILEKNWIERE